MAAERDLRPDWLNDRAAAFVSAGLIVADCEVLFEHTRLIDHDDMVAIWPRCSFPSPQAAVAAFHAAYPHEEHDPHLVNEVARIAAAASI